VDTGIQQVGLRLGQKIAVPEAVVELVLDGGQGVGTAGARHDTLDVEIDRGGIRQVLVVAGPGEVRFVVDLPEQARTQGCVFLAAGAVLAGDRICHLDKAVGIGVHARQTQAQGILKQGQVDGAAEVHTVSVGGLLPGEGALHVAFENCGVGCARADVVGTAGRILAVERALGAPQQFDAFNIDQCREGRADGALGDIVYEDRDALGRGEGLGRRSDAAQADGRSLNVGEKFHTGRQLGGLGEIENVECGQLLMTDHGHGNGHVPQGFLAFLGGDDDLFEVPFEVPSVGGEGRVDGRRAQTAQQRTRRQEPGPRAGHPESTRPQQVRRRGAAPQ